MAAPASAAGTLSPVEACRAVLARIDAIDRVLAGAAVSEARWRSAVAALWRSGFDQGPDVGAGLALPLWQPGDDPAVEHMRARVCVFTGKVTTPEFGNSGITDSPLTRLPVSPWDLGRTPGGSSGGSVAAVAAGAGPLSLGSNGGGPITRTVLDAAIMMNAMAHTWPGDWHSRPEDGAVFPGLPAPVRDACKRIAGS